MPLSWVVGSNTVQHNENLPSAVLQVDLHNNILYLLQETGRIMEMDGDG